MDDLGQTLLLIFGVLCVLPLVTFAVLAFIIYRTGMQRVEGWFEPDATQLSQRMDDLRQKNPDATTEQLVNKMIHRQALRAGVVGAITGIGGFWTLPLALPLDLALSFRIQATLVNFIAYLYGETDPSPINQQVRAMLVMTGSSRVTGTTINLLTRLAVRVAGKSLAKMIPFLGAVISFAVNYLIVQVMGRAAAKWYARQQPGKEAHN
jgi:hypothetical protein